MVRNDNLQKTNVQHGCDTILVAADEYSLIVHSEHPPKLCPKAASGATCSATQKHGSCVASAPKTASRLCKSKSNCSLVPPSSIKQSVLTSQEVEDRVKFSILSSDQIQKCLVFNSKDVLTVGGNDVTCVGCRKGVETLLDSMKNFPLACFSCFECLGGGKIRMKPGSLKFSDSLYHNLAVSKYRIKEIYDSIPRRNKTRCVYHSVNHDMGGAKEAAVQWKVLWDNTSPECRKDILKISYEELKNSHEVYVKKHRFCEDCQDHLMHAFRLLFYLEDYSEFEDFDPEIYDCLTVEQCAATGEKFICVPADLDVLAEMMDRLKNQLDTNNPNEERHARSLDVAQKEMVLCIAMFIYKRIQSIVMRFSAFITCVELLPHLIYLTFRKKLEEAVEDIEGQIRIEKTLHEIAMVDARLEAQKERKREKKRNKKNRNKGGNQLKETEDSEPQENFQLEMFLSGGTKSSTVVGKSISDNACIINPKTDDTCRSARSQNPETAKSRGCSTSPYGNCSDGGYSTGESASPRTCGAANGNPANSRRKSNKSSSSSSELSSKSATSPSNPSMSPTSSTSPVRTSVNSDSSRKKERLRPDNKTQTKGQVISSKKCTKTSNSIQNQPGMPTSKKGQRKGEEKNQANVRKSKEGSERIASKDETLSLALSSKKEKGTTVCSNNQSSKTKGNCKHQHVCLLDYGCFEDSCNSQKVADSKRQSVAKSSTSVKVRAANPNVETSGSSSNFLTADEIAEFKKQHGDYLKNRDIIRAKVKTRLEHKLEVGALVC